VQVKHWCGASGGERPGASSGAQGGFRRVSSSVMRAKERTRLGRAQKRCGKTETSAGSATGEGEIAAPDDYVQDDGVQHIAVFSLDELRPRPS
jgi:hypothetical protein